jgi:hypothetical protein
MLGASLVAGCECGLADEQRGGKSQRCEKFRLHDY